MNMTEAMAACYGDDKLCCRPLGMVKNGFHIPIRGVYGRWAPAICDWSQPLSMELPSPVECLMPWEVLPIQAVLDEVNPPYVLGQTTQAVSN